MTLARLTPEFWQGIVSNLYFQLNKRRVEIQVKNEIRGNSGKTFRKTKIKYLKSNESLESEIRKNNIKLHTQNETIKHQVNQINQLEKTIGQHNLRIQNLSQLLKMAKSKQLSDVVIFESYESMEVEFLLFYEFIFKVLWHAIKKYWKHSPTSLILSMLTTIIIFILANFIFCKFASNIYYLPSFQIINKRTGSRKLLGIVKSNK